MRGYLIFLAGLVVLGCGGSSDGDSNWDYRNGIPGLSKGGGASEARSSPRGGVCPDDAPLVCQDLCCPADQLCSEDGCVAPADPPACSSDGTLCQAVACTDGICPTADSGIHANDVTVQSPAGFVSGRFGQGVTPGRALSVDCQNDTPPTNIRAPAEGFPRVHQAMTIEAWIKVDPDLLEGTQVIIAYREGLMPDVTFDTMWAFTVISSGLRFELGTDQLNVCAARVVHDESWHHVAVTSDGGAGDPSTYVVLYWDGLWLGDCQLPGIGIMPMDGNKAVYIGQQPRADKYSMCYQPLQGVLDELRVTNRELTFDEILQDAAAELSLDENSTLTAGLWHFDDRTEYCCPALYECSDDNQCVETGCSGEDCIPVAPAPRVCPAWAPLQCGPEHCCGFGSECVEVAAGVYDCLTARADLPPHIPDPDTGCLFSHPDPCGDYCCLFYASCSNGQCGCPSGREECGSLCCAEGIDCVDDRCQGGAPCPDEDYPEECGERECCAAGFSCVDGTCACSGDYPVDCGPFCCLPGATCDYVQDFCSCPAGRAACGFMNLHCCADGYECKDDKCVKKSGGNGTCPGGWMGSTRSCGAVGISDECTCIGETNICITRTMYEEGTGLPFPPGCAADGTTGCLSDQGILVNPCCPGLTCVYRDRCGGVSNGICKEYQ